ncbi:MAG TPA: DEAD/DEAH box helicase [Polyangiaceae bacterium]|nr:DEAD/DEAH box helicase [Polyangiaceae bacterium]
MSESFSGLPEALQSALVKKGFSELTSVQQAVSTAESLSRDLRISSQTGSGKTVAVGIAIARELLAAGPRQGQRIPSALLLTPTRELANQVQRELAWLLENVADASVEVVTGGTAVFAEKKLLARGPRLVVGTPGRVLDHLRSGALVGESIGLVILDEADQMLDMGFRDELTAILESLPARSRTHLVSATFSGEVLRVAQQYQNAPLHLQGSALGAANSDIEHVAHVVGNNHRYDALVNILLLAHARRAETGTGRTLVFTRTRADTIEVAERLQQEGVAAEPLSGELAQAQRTRTLSAFRQGRITTLVATDVAARGLDVQGIDLVVHFDAPGDPDTFTHRSGRTGRAGQKGTSVVLLPPPARRRVERLFQAARVSPSWAPVPTPDKIEKAYLKLGRRKLFEALDQEAPEETLAYAAKLLEENKPEAIIAALLGLVDTQPPCAPREVAATFGEGGGRHAGAHEGFAPRRPRDNGGGFRKGPGPREQRDGHRDGYAPRDGGGYDRGNQRPDSGSHDGPRPQAGFAPRSGGDEGPRESRGRDFAPRSGPRPDFAPRSGPRPDFAPRGPKRPAGSSYEGSGNRDFAAKKRFGANDRGGASRPFDSVPGKKFGGPRPPQSNDGGGEQRGPRDGQRREGGFAPRPFKKAPRPAGPRGR